MSSPFLGVDLGGTGTRIVLTDEAGTVLDHRSVPTATDPAGAVSDLGAALEAVAAEGVTALGIGASGPIDADGVVRNPSTLPAYTGADLVGTLARRLGVPVVIDNDAVTAAYAEDRLGAGRDVRAVLMITLGTGVGVAMIRDGRPRRTPSGTHPEAGHLWVPGEAPCYCGRTSCWEQHASRSSLQTRAAGLGLTLESAADRARAGDSEAIGLFTAYGVAVGRGLADLVTLLDPDVVVVGGGGARFLDLYRATLEATLSSVVDNHQPPIRPAVVGDLAGAVGAALLARAL